MLHANPSKRPSSRMICQAFEEIRDFPRVIEAQCMNWSDMPLRLKAPQSQIHRDPPPENATHIDIPEESPPEPTISILSDLNPCPDLQVPVPKFRPRTVSPATPAVVGYRPPSLLRPPRLSPPSVTTPRMNTSECVSSPVNMSVQEPPITFSLSTQFPEGLTGALVNASTSPVTLSPLGSLVRGLGSRSDRIPSSRSHEPSSPDGLPSLGLNNGHLVRRKVVREPQPMQSLEPLQSGPWPTPSTFHQNSSTSSQDSSGTLVGGDEVLFSKGKAKDLAAQSLGTTECEPEQLAPQQLEDGNLF